MIRNRIVAVCLVVALALGFCACDEFVTTLSTGNTDIVLPLVEIDIGLVLPLTGEHASAYGFSMQRGSISLVTRLTSHWKTRYGLPLSPRTI